MKLVHYSQELFSYDPKRKYGLHRTNYKPIGLWVSDDACEANWKAWCQAENYNTEALQYAYEVTLKKDNNILLLSSCLEIDDFCKKYPLNDPRFADLFYIDWGNVKKDYNGIIISPYQWKRRLFLQSNWYYAWDCASGCIWNLDSIEKVQYFKNRNENE